MAEYVLLDAGMGGLVIILVGVGAIVFAVVAFIIIRLSIRAIKSELLNNRESEELKSQSVNEKETETEHKDGEI